MFSRWKILLLEANNAAKEGFVPCCLTTISSDLTMSNIILYYGEPVLFSSNPKHSSMWQTCAYYPPDTNFYFTIYKQLSDSLAYNGQFIIPIVFQDIRLLCISVFFHFYFIFSKFFSFRSDTFAVPHPLAPPPPPTKGSIIGFEKRFM